MFSGGDSTGSPKNTQWSMNPATYQNAATDQVDWAALAQQWIIMKEAGPPPIPRAPQVAKVTHAQEGGEAEMDLQTEKEESASWNPAGPEDAPPAPGAEAWTNWSWSGNNWNPNVPPPPVKTPLLPTPNSLYPSDDNAVSYGGNYNSGSQQPNNFNQNQPAFWTGMAVGKIIQTEIKPHNKRYSKVNVPTKVTIITPASGAPVAPPPPIVSDVSASLPTLDANKRKQLPAWIREGLEKMERDKQKQLEKEKEKMARDETVEKVMLDEKEKMEILKTTMKEKNLLRRSRFDSDNEVSEDEDTGAVGKPRVSSPPLAPLTPEELMLKVRKTMTEILLKVTNQLIEQTCTEERQRYLKKSRASDQLASAPSGAVIKAKLGLGAYDDGSSSNDSSDSDDGPQENKSDSDAELRELIKKRQAAFSKTEQEIENRLDEAERNKDRSPSGSRSSSPESRKVETSQAEPNAVHDRRSYSHSPSPQRSDENSNSSSNYLTSKSRRRSSSSNDSRSKNRDSSRSRSVSAEPSRKKYSKSPRRRSRSSSTTKSSRRERSVDSYRRDSTDSRRRSKRSQSPYSRRSRRSRSRSRSPYKKSAKKSRRSRSRSSSRDRRYHSSKQSSRFKKRSRSRSSSRSHKKSRSHRSSSRRRSRSSSRGKRSRRR